MKSNRIFGTHPVIEAIESGRTIDKLFIQKSASGANLIKIKQLARTHQIPTQFVPIEKLNRLTGKNHQGVFAFLSAIDFHRIDYILPEIYESGQTPILLILDKISDVRNFGAICRTAECAGVHAIVIPEKGSAAVNEDAIKTSAGALYNLPICREKNLKKVCSFLQMSGIQLIAATEKANDHLYAFDLVKPTAIVLGSEESGVSNEILSICDGMAKLPLFGKTKSLNVSVACGAFLFESVRQKMA